MKKTLSLALALLLLLAPLTGCQKESGESAPAQNADSTQNANSAAAASGDYFEWDGNIITALTEEGARQESLVIPENCEGLSNYIFSASAQENQVKTVTFAGQTCDVKDFLSYSELEQVTLPAGLTEIVDNMFFFCGKLQSIEIPAGATRIGQFAFEENVSLTSVTFLGDAVTSIGQYAFSGCESLGEVTLPASLEEVGDSAFAGCVSMKSLTLPASLRSVGLLAFADCGLEDLYIPAELEFETVADTSFYQAGMLRVHVVEGSWMDLNFDNVFLDSNYYEKVYQ